MLEVALAQAIARRQARAIILKDDAAWQQAYDTLRDAYTRAWNSRMQEAIAAALDRLRDLPAGTFSEDDAAAILSTLETAIGPAAMRGAVQGPVVNLSDILFRLGATEVGAAAGVDIAFGRPDLRALDILTRGNLYWVENHWNAHTRGRFDAILTDYFRDGMTRDQLTARMAQDFASLGERSEIYWEMLADHTATKTRELGRVSGYEQAGVMKVQVRAHLDHKTSDICRAMNGRIIEVSRLADQRDSYLDAISRMDAPAAKEAWAMHSGAGQIATTATGSLPKNTASPPYHFRCRTITVMYVEPAGGAGVAATVWNRDALSRADVADLVEDLKTARWRNPASLKGHYEKHGARFGSMADYNQAAIDLIRRADRDVYLSVRGGRVKAVFARKIGQRGRHPTHELTVVDVAGKQIETCHVRTGPLGARHDQVQPVAQPGRGIAKWLSRLLTPRKRPVF